MKHDYVGGADDGYVRCDGDDDDEDDESNDEAEDQVDGDEGELMLVMIGMM